MRSRMFFCGYRDWALRIYDFVKDKADFTLIKSEEEFKEKIKENPDLVLFIGWSWIVREEIVNRFTCVCLHPSPLPKYRGGSPLQHQIINGEDESAVTLFRMDKNVDKGPILWQEHFSLAGNLNDIFDRIVEVGKVGVSRVVDKFLKGNLEGVAQDESKATYFKRRTPEQSEITLEDLKNQTSKQIYDKIRALQDPYPNAFIVCKDGTKLFLKEAGK